MQTKGTVTTQRWNEEYQRIVDLTAKRNVYFGVWDASSKVVWACHKALKEYEGKVNRDETYVGMLLEMKAAAEGKVSQLDPVIARIDSEINARMEFIQNNDGVA
jgi:hypothetical protein